jgi:hypothetical protein
MWIFTTHPGIFNGFEEYLTDENFGSKFKRGVLFKYHPDKNPNATESEKEGSAQSFLVAQSNYQWLMNVIRPAMVREAELARELGCEAKLVEILVAEYYALLNAPVVVATPAPAPAPAAPAPAPPASASAAAPTPAGVCVCVCVCVCWH